MHRTIRYPDGTIRHIYAGPAARPWWRRHRSALACTVLLAIAILAAHYGAHR